MKVWVVIDHDWESDTIRGIYSTEALATQACVTFEGAEVEEWAVDEHKDVLERGGRLWLFRCKPDGSWMVEKTSGEPGVGFDYYGRLMVSVWAASPEEAAPEVRKAISEVKVWPKTMKEIAEMERGRRFDLLDTITIIDSTNP